MCKGNGERGLGLRRLIVGWFHRRLRRGRIYGDRRRRRWRRGRLRGLGRRGRGLLEVYFCEISLGWRFNETFERRDR